MNKLFFCILAVALIAVSYNAGKQKGEESVPKVDSTRLVIDTVSIIKNDFYSNPEEIFTGKPEDDLYEVMNYYGIRYPEIAFAIAVQETGWFKSNLCVKYNNLFGLYDSKNKSYMHFKTWYESVKAYKELVEDKYNDEDGYYEFLKKLPYSSDKNYINKIKEIELQNKGME